MSTVRQVLADPLGLVVSVAAGVVALGVIGRATRGAYRWLRQLGRAVRAIDDVVQRELGDTHDGESTKEDVAGMAVAVGKLGRQFDDFKREVRAAVKGLSARIDHHHPPEENDDGS